MILSFHIDATVSITARKEVILSAGTLGTPHVLLNSGIGGKSDLDQVGVNTIHHLPDVGKGMSDHVLATVAWSMNGSAPVYVNLSYYRYISMCLFRSVSIDRDAALEQWMKDRTGPMSEWYEVGKQILWSRLSDESPLLGEYGDPASGPEAPHIEIPLGFVSFDVFSS